MDERLHTTSEIVASCRQAMETLDGWKPVAVKCNSQYGDRRTATTAQVPMPEGLWAAISAYRREVRDYVGRVVLEGDRRG